MAEINFDTISARLNRLQSIAKKTALLMIGVPDYNNYLEHMQLHHPELPKMTKAEFFQRAQEGRYAGKKLNKCPC